jgi:hypothetical protein
MNTPDTYSTYLPLGSTDVDITKADLFPEKVERVGSSGELASKAWVGEIVGKISKLTRQNQQYKERRMNYGAEGC